MKDLISKRSIKRFIAFTIRICLYSYVDNRGEDIFSLDVRYRLSFKHDYSLFSFHPKFWQNTQVSNLLLGFGHCTNYDVYMRPWLEKIPSKFILHTEINSTSWSRNDTDRKPREIYPKTEIYSEV
ncbi:hypothetical protein RF11_00820 [Thelohanellus kitauei]|uniref:Uncharacterized protein n=1 Tax=Thelohanellus kitauei TaxID=669202 RepID=A0A0C2JCG8_THEKT|nr:hypothetical protein RF11_00820 [Thelohanellus kitauei]